MKELFKMIDAVFTTMPMFVCGFWTVMLLLRYKGLDRARLLLTVFMITATLLYTSHCFYFNRCYQLIPVTDTIYSFATLAVYPLYFVYISALTDAKKLGFPIWLVLLPALVLSVAVGTVFLMMDGAARTDFVMDYLYQNDTSHLSGDGKIQMVLHLAIKVVFAIQIIPCLLLGIKKISAYNHKVMSYYSDTESKTITPLKLVMILFVVASLLSFTINFIGRQWFIGSPYILIIPSLLFSILLFAIGYIGYRQEFTAMDMLEETSGAEPVAENSVPDTDLQQKIIRAVEDEKLYLRTDLKISDLADSIRTNRNYIYTAINVDMGITFTEFINRYRIQYAKQLLKENPGKKIHEISLMSGFASEISFYRNFKLFEGMTPAQWSKKQQPLLS